MNGVNREVVLRVLQPWLYLSDGEVQRIAQKTKAALALKHCNIATIYETWETEGKLFIATEYIQGKPLRLRVEPLSTAAVVGIAMDVADALIRAHSLGIVHGGIKPSNITMTPDGHVKLLNFGVEPELTDEIAGLPDWSQAFTWFESMPGSHSLDPIF